VTQLLAEQGFVERLCWESDKSHDCAVC